MRVEPATDQLHRAQQLRQPLECVVLRLHRHEHAVGGGEGVDGQRPERGRTVEENEVVAVASRGECLREIPLAVRESRELHGGPGEVGLGRHEVEVRERRSMNELGEGRAVEQVVARASVRPHAES